MKYYFFLLLLLPLAGCNKDRTDISDHPELIGDFDWTYSQVSSTEIMTKEDSQDDYGLRFVENGRVYAFKNGKLDKKGIVEDVRPAGTKLLVRVKLKKQNAIEFTLSNNQLSSKSYPYGEINPWADFINVFQKK